MQGKHPWKQGEQVKDDATPKKHHPHQRNN